MNATRHLFWAALLVLMTTPAVAQDTPAQPPTEPAAEPAPVDTPKADAPAETPTETETPTPEATPDPPPEGITTVAPPQVLELKQAAHTDRAQALILYHQAFELVAGGERIEARRVLRELYETYPDTEFAPKATILYGLLDPRNKPRDEGRSSGLARAEFITFQTLHGIALGAEFCLLVDCNTQGVAASTITGAAAGLGLSLWASNDGIEDGRVQAIDSGVLWGAWHGLALIGMGVFEKAETAAGAMMAFQLTGLAAGELTYRLFKPSAGDVSLGVSGGLWTGAVTGMIMGMAEFEGSEEALFGTLLIASDVGLIGGALASEYFPMSRGRVLVIDSGGILGGLVGLGIPLLFDLKIQATGAFGSMLVGTLGGLGLATYFTRNWDAEDTALNDVPDFNLGVQPTQGGIAFNAGGSW